MKYFLSIILFFSQILINSSFATDNGDAPQKWFLPASLMEEVGINPAEDVDDKLEARVLPPKIINAGAGIMPSEWGAFCSWLGVLYGKSTPPSTAMTADESGDAGNCGSDSSTGSGASDPHVLDAGVWKLSLLESVMAPPVLRPAASSSSPVVKPSARLRKPKKEKPAGVVNPPKTKASATTVDSEGFILVAGGAPRVTVAPEVPLVESFHYRIEQSAADGVSEPKPVPPQPKPKKTGKGRKVQSAAGGAGASSAKPSKPKEEDLRALIEEYAEKDAKAAAIAAATSVPAPSVAGGEVSDIITIMEIFFPRYTETISRMGYVFSDYCGYYLTSLRPVDFADGHSLPCPTNCYTPPSAGRPENFTQLVNNARERVPDYTIVKWNKDISIKFGFGVRVIVTLRDASHYEDPNFNVYSEGAYRYFILSNGGCLSYLLGEDEDPDDMEPLLGQERATISSLLSYLQEVPMFVSLDPVKIRQCITSEKVSKGGIWTLNYLGVQAKAPGSKAFIVAVREKKGLKFDFEMLTSTDSAACSRAFFALKNFFTDMPLYQIPHHEGPRKPIF